MPIKKIHPPKASLNAVKIGLPRFTRESEPSLADGALALTAPHRCYALRQSDLLAGRGFEVANATGWRYLVRVGSSFVGVAETADGDEAQPESLAKVDPPTRADFVASLLRRAELWAQAREVLLELRYLRIPAANAAGIWLHADAEDWIYPVELGGKRSTADDSRETHPIAGQEFIADARRLAVKRADDDKVKSVKGDTSIAVRGWFIGLREWLVPRSRSEPPGPKGG